MDQITEKVSCYRLAKYDQSVLAATHYLSIESIELNRLSLDRLLLKGDSNFSQNSLNNNIIRAKLRNTLEIRRIEAKENNAFNIYYLDNAKKSKLILGRDKLMINDQGISPVLIKVYNHELEKVFSQYDSIKSRNMSDHNVYAIALLIGIVYMIVYLVILRYNFDPILKWSIILSGGGILLVAIVGLAESFNGRMSDKFNKLKNLLLKDIN